MVYSWRKSKQPGQMQCWKMLRLPDSIHLQHSHPHVSDCKEGNRTVLCSSRDKIHTFDQTLSFLEGGHRYCKSCLVFQIIELSWMTFPIGDEYHTPIRFKITDLLLTSLDVQKGFSLCHSLVQGVFLRGSLWT